MTGFLFLKCNKWQILQLQRRVNFMDIFVNKSFNPPPLEERLVKRKDLMEFEDELVDKIDREFDNFNNTMNQMLYSLDPDPRCEIDRSIQEAIGNEPENFYGQ
jgi:hypothetical protein